MYRSTRSLVVVALGAKMNDHRQTVSRPTSLERGSSDGAGPSGLWTMAGLLGRPVGLTEPPRVAAASCPCSI